MRISSPRKLVASLAASLSMLVALPASAVTLKAGDVARIDFDLTESGNGQKYDSISYTFRFGDPSIPIGDQSLSDVWDPGDAIRTRWFASDGTELGGRTSGPNLFGTPQLGWSTADLLSPLRSGVIDYGTVEMLEGGFIFSAATVQLRNAVGGQTDTVDATISLVSDEEVNVVPLPAGAWFLISASVGLLVFARRRATPRMSA